MKSLAKTPNRSPRGETSHPKRDWEISIAAESAPVGDVWRVSGCEDDDDRDDSSSD